MKRILPIYVFLALLAGNLLFLAAPAAAAKAAFFETTAAIDTANDFSGNGALDIVAVHFSEKYRFNKDDRTGEDVLIIRWELRAISGHTCGSTSRYDVSFTSGGQVRNHYASITSNPGGDDSCIVKAADGTGAVKLNETSVTLTIPSSSVGLAPGVLLTGICAKSSAMAPAPVGQPQYQDVVPLDNANAPMSACPTASLPSYTGKGVFPLVLVEPIDGLFRYSVNGREVEFDFNVSSHPALSGDQISVYFDAPDGWALAPSQGTTGADPVGSFTGGANGAARRFSFSASDNRGTAIGETVLVGMNVISDSGGHVNLTAIIEVTGEKIEDPAIRVSLLSPGPFKAGQSSEVRFHFAYDNDTIDGQAVKVDLLQGRKRVATFVAVEKGSGIYAALVQFPGAGTYTLDAYLASQTPSPHQAFTIQVEKAGGLLPASTGVATLLLIAGGAWLRRRQG